MVIVGTRGLEALMNVVASAAARGVRTRPLMWAAGQIVLASVARNFEEGGRPASWPPWAPLTRRVYEGLAVERARATRRWQRAGEERRRSIEAGYVAHWVGGAKLLHRSGDLKKSVTIGEVSDARVVVGSSLPYARIHQLGGVVRPRRHRFLFVPAGGNRFLRLREARIPARPYLLFQDEDRRAIVLAARRFLLEGEV